MHGCGKQTQNACCDVYVDVAAFTFFILQAGQNRRQCCCRTAIDLLLVGLEQKAAPMIAAAGGLCHYGPCFVKSFQGSHLPHTTHQLHSSSGIGLRTCGRHCASHVLDAQQGYSLPALQSTFYTTGGSEILTCGDASSPSQHPRVWIWKKLEANE